MNRELFSKPWIIFMFFLALGCALYGTAFDNGFYFDDLHQISQNPFIRSLDSIPTFFWSTEGYSRSHNIGHYRPILLSTFDLNYVLGGMNPWGYHLVNLAFHVGSVFVVFLIVRLLVRSSLAAWVAALVMLFHPFNSEVVNYITARSSVMAAFFYLLAFYCYLRYRRERDRHLGWLVGTVSVFVLGMLTKEILLTLPLILLLYEFLLIPKADRSWRRLVQPLSLLLILTLSYLGIRKYLLGAAGPTDIARDFGSNLLQQVHALAGTWEMLVLPMNLSLVHELPATTHLLDGAFWGAVVVLLATFLVMVWGVRSSSHDGKLVGFFFAWFYITLAPTIIVPLNMALQENRAYIAVPAYAILLGVLVSRLVAGRTKNLQLAVLGGFGCLLLAYAAGIQDRNAVWDNEMSLWQDAVQKAPHSDQAHYALGMSYSHLKWYEPAAMELQTAAGLNGMRSDIHSDLGGVYMYMGRPDLAEPEYWQAIRLDPLMDTAYTNLGILYRKRGDPIQAQRAFEKALSLYPYSELALYNLSRLLVQRGQTAEAVALLKRTLQRNPNLPRIQILVGRLYRDQGQLFEAQQAFEQAQRLDPSFHPDVERP